MQAQASTAGTDKPGYFYYLINAWILIPAIVYFSVLNEYTVNIPMKDDYEAILKYLVNFKNADFGGKISLLFSQHGEHRILHSRILYSLYYLVFGDVNLRSFAFIGSAQLLVIFGVITYFIRKAVGRYWNIVALLFGMCLFDVNNYENVETVMAGVQNYGIVMLFLLSLFFYSRVHSKWNLSLAVFFQVLAIYSSGNGIVASLFLVLFNFLSGNRRLGIISLVAMLVFGPLYFVGYTSVPHGEQAAVGTIITYFLHIAGAHFSYEYGVISAVLMFVVLAAVLPITKQLKFKENTLFFLCLLGFVLASMATAAVFRAFQPMLQSYASRYFIYTHLLTGIIVVLGAVKLKDKKVQLPALIAAAVLLVIAYKGNYEYGIQGFEREQARLTHMEFYFMQGRTEEARKISEDACREGIYCISDER